MPAEPVVVGAIALIAAAAQTISGFGMNLLLAPVAQVIVPGSAAVRLVAGLGAALNLTVLARSWRAVLWGPAGLLLMPTLVATFLIEPLLRGHGATSLAVLAAIVTLFAIAATFVGRAPERLSGRLRGGAGRHRVRCAERQQRRQWSTSRRRHSRSALVGVAARRDCAGGLLAQQPRGLRRARQRENHPGLIFGGIAGTFGGVFVGTRLRGRVSAGLGRTAVFLAAAVGTLLVLARSA